MTEQTAFSSDNDHTTPGGCGQRLLLVLLHGAANAIPGRELVKLLGLHNLRELTKEISRARRAGAPICASCSGERGYYLADDPAELEHYARSLDRRLAEVRATRAAVGDTLRRMNGQEEMRWNDAD
ncbi:MAG: hypothetical protein KBS74_01330 [Clostridiales bacterium]|nr:hypothetical protein [Candidatus Cacconaster stercorequi]